MNLISLKIFLITSVPNSDKFSINKLGKSHFLWGIFPLARPANCAIIKAIDFKRKTYDLF
ncbi:hypothetical protein DLJ51_05775 [Streptococcus sobrinus]|uniref:Uncharacterized protein n=1 Tax=Streptococcus sobrinus TaxID=1310 RepID=A0ABM6W754_9STRE|nr:hypothetical protein DK181_04860 [Streptococcus sobrinus]AWN20706.1 hypothetical protein DK182_04800 [Streptococcus sobrinus]AWN61730.1 hypothetical protein DLJ52_05775 [Streptococcus sobrinus]AWN63601.1 hypothetical protein DLJ51_05775 [Streptococcus sobrinus]OZV23504.1 hypothetical protein RO09_03260 [Streptococcus sobrinus]